MGFPLGLYFPREKARNEPPGGKSYQGPLHLVREELDFRVRPDRKYDIPRLGSRFGELTITGFMCTKYDAVAKVVVQCSCGRPEHEVYVYNLYKKKSTRCDSCAKKQTGYWKKKYMGYAEILPDDGHRSRLLDRISAIINRCENPHSSSFKWYGERGIRFEFEDRRTCLAHLITLPGWDDPSLEIDRVDNSKGYARGNLRFIARRENLANRRDVTSQERRIAELERELQYLRSTGMRTE